MKEYISRHPAALPLGVLLAACLITVFLVMQKEPLQKKNSEKLLQKVLVQSAVPQELEMPVFSQGVVEPRTKIRLLPEVAGEIISVSPKWENGGYFRKGEVFLSIEDHNYQNQLEKAKANLSRVESGLVQEEGLAYVARQEWNTRDKESDNTAAKSLALREPQLAAAKAQVDAARADVLSARRSLEKTRITAPYDGILAKKGADIGQFISAGQLLAEFYAIDFAEIRVPLTEIQLAFLDFSTVDKKMKKPVTVNYSVENQSTRLQGYMVRTEGMLDPATKVLYAVIEVRDPYGLNNDKKIQLRLGSFVSVEIPGKRMENIFVLPRKALRSGNQLWIVDKEGRLASRHVRLLPLREKEIYVYEGLSEGQQVVVGGIIDPIEGKRVAPQVVVVDSNSRTNE